MGVAGSAGEDWEEAEMTGEYEDAFFSARLSKDEALKILAENKNKEGRKIIQISAGDGSLLYALANDGTVWYESGTHHGGWIKMQPLPLEE